jgi:nucleotide-binding universal stress UspA family protein
MYARILVPLDGSDTSERGLDEAIALARPLGSQLVLLHALDAFPVLSEVSGAAAYAQIADGLQRNAEDLLDRAARRADDQGVKAETRLVEAVGGHAAEVIVREARDLGCGLVVMGTHGRRGFSHMMMGSDAESVARHADVPVLLVRHRDARRP